MPRNKILSFQHTALCVHTSASNVETQNGTNDYKNLYKAMSFNVKRAQLLFGQMEKGRVIYGKDGMCGDATVLRFCGRL